MWKLKLRDGREVLLRFLTAGDEGRLFQMFSSLSDEALRWSGALYTMDVIKRWVDNLPQLIPIVAEYNDRIVGYAVIYKFPSQIRKRIGDFAIYLDQDFHNVGLGTAMTKRILQLAKKEKMHRIELSVVEENKSAIRLYQRTGFQIEGVNKDAFYGQDDKYHNVVQMGLILKT